MLPGFRILCATIVLAASVLVFGLGAAALLRASHEEFASLPSWRLAQQPQFAPQNDTTPTLALLRVNEPPAPPVVQNIAPPPVMPSAVAEPAIVVAQDSDDAGKDADPAANMPAADPPSADAPPGDPANQMNGQADAPPVPDTPAVDSQPIDSGSSGNEASEPQTTQSITPQMRSTAATDTATLPKPVVKKANRASARAAAQRRAVARARAAARAKAVQQQPNPFPLFGG